MKRPSITLTALTAFVLTVAATFCLSAYAMGDRPESQQSDGFTKFDFKCCTREKTFVLKTLSLEPKKDMAIGIIRTDLNGDGREDFLAQVHSLIDCGTAGCSLHIFVNEGEETFREVEGPSNTYWDVKIADSKTAGMNDLFFRGKKKNEQCLWRWNNEKYVFDSCGKDS